MSPSVNRRELLTSAVVGSMAAAAADNEAHARQDQGGSNDGPKFRYCLNTSTIRGQNLSAVEEIELTAEAGYSAIEPWMRKLHEYVQKGGVLADLKKRIADLGLTVESAIGFAQWIVDNDEARAKGLEEAKRDMDLLAQIGGKRIAAPPTGAQQRNDMDLRKVGQRYRALLELGAQFQVTPMIEVWGHSQTLGRLSESMFVAYESGRADACLLPDVYHLYKGGSSFEGLKLVAGTAIPVFHMNDYPAEPPRETIKDADRVFPGDGVAPLGDILRTLHRNGSQAVLSLELFNPEYWKRDALEVARTGLAKMRESVHKAFA